MTLPLGFAENSIQLVPDGTLILHVIIILVMVFVLNATLYKPINRILEAREKRLGEELTALNAAARLNAPERAPEPAPEEVEPRAASEALRDRLESRIDLLWRTFEESLEANHADGTPDYRTRLDAARMLLGAAYPNEAATDSTPAADEERLEDELARLRDRRLEWGKGS